MLSRPATHSARVPARIHGSIVKRPASVFLPRTAGPRSRGLCGGPSGEAGLPTRFASLSFLLLGRWVAGPWSPCSATCEKGIQHREVTCVYQLQNGTHVTTRPLYCQGPRPAPVQSCEGQDCLSIWEASEWSQVGAWAAAGADTTAGASGPCPQGPRRGPFPRIMFVTRLRISQFSPAPWISSELHSSSHARKLHLRSQHG